MADSDMWEINRKATLAKHVKTGIEVCVQNDEYLHVQTDPDRYGLDIPLWLIEALMRDGGNS